MVGAARSEETATSSVTAATTGRGSVSSQTASGPSAPAPRFTTSGPTSSSYSSSDIAEHINVLVVAIIVCHVIDVVEVAVVGVGRSGDVRLVAVEFAPHGESQRLEGRPVVVHHAGENHYTKRITLIQIQIIIGLTFFKLKKERTNINHTLKIQPKTPSTPTLLPLQNKQTNKQPSKQTNK
jgi:hypothetical protein